MSQQSISSLKPRLEAATKAYQDLQEDLEKAVASRAKLEAQLLETENVKKVYASLKLLGRVWLRLTGIGQEFATLKSHNMVYKLVGPILVPQERSEAKLNVDTRLDFIRGEMCGRVLILSPNRD